MFLIGVVLFVLILGLELVIFFFVFVSGFLVERLKMVLKWVFKVF